MSRKWKAALAPWLAGIPVRTGFAGEFRFGLLNDVRFGERKLPRMIDQMGALALPKDVPLPAEWPLPELKVPAHDVQTWLAQQRLAGEGRPIVALSPGAVGAGKAWPAAHYAESGQGTRYGRRIDLDSRADRSETPLAKTIVGGGRGSCA